ncbi:hypothetical protein HDU83_009188 [Entophlyctis luteolus]|nr:hypothetical protein HDU83_009188 [Entophlyctis luteolus]
MASSPPRPRQAMPSVGSVPSARSLGSSAATSMTSLSASPIPMARPRDRATAHSASVQAPGRDSHPLGSSPSSANLDSLPRRRSFGSRGDMNHLSQMMNSFAIRGSPSSQHLRAAAMSPPTQHPFESMRNTDDGDIPSGSLSNLHFGQLQSGAAAYPISSARNALEKLTAKAASVVKNRTGAVLARSTIIKSDMFEMGLNMHLDFHLQGAPNFRIVDYNICGVAQPTASGISTILTLLKCNPNSRSTHKTIFICAREEPVIYINWRPFVLREADNPFQNIKTFQGISGSRLEQLEARLKEDILKEASKHGNMFLVHDEIENGRIVSSWVGVEDIMTSRDLFSDLQSKRYRVEYYRIPISPEQSPEDKYLDEFVEVIKKCEPDDHVVFNCGMGAGRTTFSMTVALILRSTRAQIRRSCSQPAIFDLAMTSENPRADISPNETFFVDEVDRQNRAMLKLVYILDRGLTNKSNKVSARSAIDWAMARGPLIEDLKSAVLGNYQYILRLLSLLHKGSESKKILDDAIDKCDTMVNLREVILLHRVQYSNTGDTKSLTKALGCLERYFFLLAFCSYVLETDDLGLDVTFSKWLTEREEIRRMLESIRKRGMPLQAFKPVEDLTVFSNDNQMYYAGNHGRQIANELESFVMKWRHGSVLVQHTILKVDQWATESGESQIPIDGALNFRKIPNWAVYGVAQPTIHGLVNIMKTLTSSNAVPNANSQIKKSVCWINLREEPICYINGQPYVLRDKSFTLRNTKAYSGISSSRLEYIEQQLRDDVISELGNFESKILVHTESDNATHPVWEECTQEYVLTVREVVELLQNEGHPILYYRVPLTAERAPDPGEMDDLVTILSKIDLQNTAIVLNCQVGLGRSTVGTIVASLVLDWLHGPKSANLSSSSYLDLPNLQLDAVKPASKPLNYQVIHSLIRVIKNGAFCRRWVDRTIDGCSQHSTHIRDAIESWRILAESEAEDSPQRRRAVRKGLACLRRYFALIAFAAYLDSKPNHTAGGELESFKDWMAGHQEFDTILEEMEHTGMKSLVPVEHLSPGDGIALTNEVLEVIETRNGAVLAKHTILKVDVFPGAQKLSLVERVDGAPNYRKIPLEGVLKSIGYYPRTRKVKDRSVYGIGMPTIDAIKNTLDRCSAGPGGRVKVFWTSLREEPVIYVKGRPFVLRLFQEPTKNIETTGIIRERVEQMEQQMKEDVIAELTRCNGRLLLHNEEQIGTGFAILGVWESCTVEDIKTPLEVYQMIVAQNYRVDYKRVPITDEQAPIPAVFDQLVERLSGLEGDSEAIFNCQMGRGRTTTGIVIACLFQMIVGNKDVIKIRLDPVEDVPQSPVGLLEAAMNDSFNSEANRIHERYSNGEYKIILQVVGALEYGRLAKKLTDCAIDKCEHLQNLRGAILDYKLRQQKWLALKSIGLNYLIRYFYLIVFAEYLIEEMSEVLVWPAKPAQTFTTWLEDRREIVNIAKRGDQTFD